MPMILFMILFLAPNVYASSVIESDFEMLLPRAFQQNLIEQQWQSLQDEEIKMNWDIADQSFETPDVKVQIEGLKINMQTRLEKPALDVDGESITLQSRDLQAQLLISAVVVDQYIEREIGGVIGRFRIQARCENVPLQMQKGKGEFEMRLSPVFDKGLLRARLEELKIAWSPDAWTMGPLVCEGAEGFDDLVRDELLKLSGDSTILDSKKAELMESIQEYLDTKSLDLSKPRSLVSPRPDIKASMQVLDFVAGAQQANVRGLLKVEFTKGKSRNSQKLLLSTDSLQRSSGDEFLVRVPEKLISALTEQAFLAGTWFRHISSRSVPGFTRLMQSRWNQFAVWPELLRYPKDALFLFDLGASQGVKVTGKYLHYQVEAPLQAWMYAPRGDQHIPFMSFSIPLKSQVNLVIEQGRVRATFKKVHLGLKHRWDPTYVAKYGRYQKFSGKTIAERVVKEAEGASFEYLLPKIPLSKNLSLRVQKIRSLPKEDLVIHLR